MPRHLISRRPDPRHLVALIATAALALGSLGLAGPARADDGTGEVPIATTSASVEPTSIGIEPTSIGIEPTDASVDAVDEPITVTSTDEPVVTTTVEEPVIDEPVTTTDEPEPVTTEPTETDTSEPVTTEPITTAPVTTEPAATANVVPDPGFQACLNTEYLGQDADAPITAAQLEALAPQNLLDSTDSAIDCSNRSITSLEGAQYLTSIEVFNAFDNDISDLSPLAGLTGLTSMNLDDNPIFDLAPLAGLTNLTTLCLDHTKVTDLSPLAGLTKMAYLYIQANPITDLTPLAGMTAMQQLYFYGDPVTDLTPLSGMADLNAIAGGDNNISSVTPLAGLSKLVWVNLNDNHITDLSSLTSDSLRWTTITTVSGSSTVTGQTASLSVTAGQATQLPVRSPLADRPVTYTLVSGNATLNGGTITMPVGTAKIGWTIPGDIFTGTLTVTATGGSGPVVAGVPTIVGTPEVDQTLTADPGQWQGATSFAYQWLRDGWAIRSATDAQYVPTPSDQGRQLSVRVTGSGDGTASATATSASVTITSSRQVTAGDVEISGTPVVGAHLVAQTGTWLTNGPVTQVMRFGYQWLRDGQAIRGATGPGYNVTSADAGHEISVRVTGSMYSYASATTTSPAVSVEQPVVTLALTDSVGATNGAARLANGSDWYTLTATAADADGAPLSNLYGLRATASSSRVVVTGLSDNGDGTYDFAAFAYTPGDYTIQMQLGGANVGEPVSVNFVGATASPSSVQPGQTVKLTAQGFLPDEQIAVTSSPDGQAWTLTAGTDGSASVSFTVPDDATPGTYTLTLKGQTSGTVTTTYRVAAAQYRPQPWPAPAQVWWTRPAQPVVWSLGWLWNWLGWR